MTKILLIAALAITGFSSQAQLKEGRVVYERVMQNQFRASVPNPEIAAQIPKSRTDNFELLFSQDKTLWSYLPSATTEESSTFSSGGMTIQMRSANMNEVSFQDFQKGLRVDQREVMERNFVVTDSIRKLNWKLSDETKKILNFTTRKATSQRISSRTISSMENGELKRQQIPDTLNIVAWFTSEIPVAGGPTEYQGQLPGLILEMDINKGQTVYKAMEVSPKVSVSKIKEPKEGKKVTAAEYNTEREKILEEMRKNIGPGNNVRISSN